MIKVREQAFKYYFHFMEQRMNIFWARYNNEIYPWTNDSILLRHKFTNVYRSCDRVSQYLIRNVIYGENAKIFSEKDILLRILIFKIFNKIETWKYLESNVGEISLTNFDIEHISRLLSDRIAYRPIFSSAYLMTGSHKDYTQYPSKHERWLQMVNQKFIKEKLFDKILKSKSLEEVFFILSDCPFIGNFLAYQYAIDINYSEIINFDENSFVKAGIGAIRGIKKCFEDSGGYSNEDLIRYTHDNIEKYRTQYGYSNFKNLFGREPTLIDLQNCFCETDKYLRVKMPELKVDNIRIKQIYRRNNNNINYFFPPKWGINDKIKTECLQSNTKELTLFS
ncbi:MAG: ATP-binding protein [Bacteroidales bacterium]